MEVTSGSEWTVQNGANRRSFSVTLDENDGTALIPGFESLEWNVRMDQLQKRADAEVLKYMFRDGAISEEFLRERLESVRAR